MKNEHGWSRHTPRILRNLTISRNYGLRSKPDTLEDMLKKKLFESVRLTVAETHENKFKTLRPRFRSLRSKVADAYPVSRVNLDWI